MPSISTQMRNLSRDELVSITVIGITAAVLAWYQTNLTGVQRLTTAVLTLLVSMSCATAVTVVLKRWNPHWYRS